MKTSSIIKPVAQGGWPRTEEAKLAILSYPGEKGYDTIPRDDPTVLPFIFEFADIEKLSPFEVVHKVESATAAVLSGKYGTIMTFAGDGGHKLYEWYFQRAFLDKLNNPPKGWDGNEEKMVGPAYGQAHKDYGLYMTKLLTSSVPYAVVTFWNGLDKIDPLNPDKNAPRAYFADLPGLMGRRVGGEFSAALFAETLPADQQGFMIGRWVTKIEGHLQGIGIKVDPRIAQNIPRRIPQHFGILQAHMSGDHVRAATMTAQFLAEQPVRRNLKGPNSTLTTRKET